MTWDNIVDGEDVDVVTGKLNVLGNKVDSIINWKSEAGAIEEDVNFILTGMNDVEFTLDTTYAHPIMIELLITGRNPKIVTGTGITINGNTENLILEGGQGDKYVLVDDGQGNNNYILIAQGSAAFSFEGLVSGAISAVSIYDDGQWVGATAGQYTATQFATSGTGIDAEFLVTITSSSPGVTSVDSIVTGGSGHSLGDLITIDMAGMGGFVALRAVLEVTAT